MAESPKEARKEGRETQAKGLWNQFSGRVKEAWGSLTDDDVDRYEGRRDQLIGRIQEKTGKSRAEVAQKLDEISDDTNYRF